MADADAATKIDDLDLLENELKKIEKDTHGIALGSRRHLQKLAEKKVLLFLRCIISYPLEKMVQEPSDVGIPHSGTKFVRERCGRYSMRLQAIYKKDRS
jgi:hypothetical protein